MVRVLPAPHVELQLDRLSGYPGPQLDVFLPGGGELAGQEGEPSPEVTQLLLGDEKIVQQSRLAQDDGGHLGQTLGRRRREVARPPTVEPATRTRQLPGDR